MKKIHLLILFTFAFNLFAQENDFYKKNFDAYKDYLLKESGILFKMPENYKDLNKYYVSFKIREDHAKFTGNMYGPMLISKDKECIVMYPATVPIISKEIMEYWKKRTPASARPGPIENEIKTSLGLFYGPGNSLNNNSVKIDFDDYVTVIAGKKAREMFNADSIYIYDIPGADSVFFFDKSIEKMRKEKYPNCTSLIILKNGTRGSIDIKLFFTEKGRKNKEKYINMLSKNIWYDEDFKEED